MQDENNSQASFTSLGEIGPFKLVNHVSNATVTSGALQHEANVQDESLSTNIMQASSMGETSLNEQQELFYTTHEAVEFVDPPFHQKVLCSTSDTIPFIQRSTEQENFCRLPEELQIVASACDQESTFVNIVQKGKLVNLVEQNYSALFGRISNHLSCDLLKSKLWKLIANKLNKMDR